MLIQRILRWFKIGVDLLHLLRFRVILGLAGYYHYFVEEVLSIAAPSTMLTQKHVPFIWSNKCEESYQKVKTALTTALVLVLPTGS